MNDRVHDVPSAAAAATPPKTGFVGTMVRVAENLSYSMFGGSGGGGRGYDGGANMREGRWGRRPFGPDNNLRTYQRDKNRVRQSIQETAVLRRARDVKASNWVGENGINPLLDQYPEIQRRWLDWSESKECDANGRHSLLGITKQIVNAVYGDGEVLQRFRDRDPDNVFDMMAVKMSGVGLQLQPMEIDHLVLGRNQVEANGTVTVEGENRSQYNNQVLGFYLYRRHPEILVSVPMSGPNLPVWVPAVDVQRISHVDRIGAQRSMPPMKPILSTNRNRQDYVDAEIIRKGVAARRTYIIQSPGLANDKEVLAQAMGHYANSNIDGQSTTGNNEFVVSMPENGEALSLPPGWEFKVTDPADVGEGFAPFMKMIGQEIAAGTGQPYVQVSMDAGQDVLLGLLVAVVLVVLLGLLIVVVVGLRHSFDSIASRKHWATIG
jgi:capsid protein